MCEQEIIPSSIVKVSCAGGRASRAAVRDAGPMGEIGCVGAAGQVENPEELLRKAAKRYAASEAD